MRYYHIWFQTKYKKYILINEIDAAADMLFRQIAETKGFQFLAYGSLLDHVHILVGLTDFQSLPTAVKMFKGISSRRISQTFPALRQQAKINSIWAKRYNYKEVAKENLPVVIKYINGQKKNLYIV